MEKETYSILAVLENARCKIQKIYNRTGYDSLVDEADFMLIKKNIARINFSISEINNYSKLKN